MTRQTADYEIKEIMQMPLKKCQEKYFVDAKEEIIGFIEDMINEEKEEREYDIFNENGFLSMYHCNKFLY